MRGESEERMMNWNVEDMILFEDKDILVCEKPAGVAVQNARIGTMDMESILKNYLAAGHPGKIPYLGVVHRLDQPVEGILVFAKTSRAAGILGRQVQDGRMEKQYLAVTEGMPKMQEGTLIDYLKKDGRTNTSSVVSKGTQGSKEARLHYEVISTGQKEDGKIRSLIKIKLDTGRHHQIRVQMAHAGMPLVGDRKYGKTQETVPLALCAASLAFDHPSDKKRKKFHIIPKGQAYQEFPKEIMGL